MTAGPHTAAAHTGDPADLTEAIISELRASWPVIISTSEAAAMTRKSKATIKRAVDCGMLPFSQPTGTDGKLMLPRDAVLAWAFTFEVRLPEKPAVPARTQQSPGTAAGGRSRSLSGSAGSTRKRRPAKRLSISRQGSGKLTPESMRAFAASVA